uniref:Glutathione peroxidase n=1 Tax=Neobodo designis TaxID=312471 RepID=A0A7S1QLN9_NEODS|mmetsp:Transcript_4825/g.15281  ORF Transcript_4825/g.15281 Transcript_4825/m.15281 type:complete len:261 (+) Transcript_4825:70-852(+)
MRSDARREKEARSTRVKLTLAMIAASVVLATIIVWTVIDRASRTKVRTSNATIGHNNLALGAIFAGNQNAVLAVSRLQRQQQLQPSAAPLAPYAPGTNVYEGVTADLLTGGAVDLGTAFDGIVTLVVNVASHCGFTESNYKELEALQRRFRGTHKFSVLAFPCNQFGAQEAGTPQEIMHFARRDKGATFPLYEKVEVNGAHAHPLYARLKAAAGVPDIEWNFGKFLVSGDGRHVQYFKHDAPFAPIAQAVEELLSGNASP